MSTIKTTLHSGLLLGIVALVCTALSSGIYFATKGKIDEAVDAQQRSLLLEVIPQDYFNNDLLADCKPLQNPQISKICTASKNGRITAYALEATAHDGYSGDIRLLIGMTPAGEVLGVRVLEHKETPGLGDKIETRKSDWIHSFDHQFIRPQAMHEWAVKKDGGKFDQFAGATITPRAVVNQVKRSALEMINMIKADKTEHNQP
ncbi:electron transport complex subunit RsxG [Pasteurellaceae bacterium LIM206]|nr:electron transport complex subunit RsxG [Pasteurellaceae bacterium LIM206]